MKEIKKKYVSPNIEIIPLGGDDVITTSGTVSGKPEYGAEGNDDYGYDIWDDAVTDIY